MTTVVQPLTILSKRRAERSSWKYEADLIDENEDAIPVSSITSIKLTIMLVDKAKTFPVINSVQQTEIKNTDRGTVDSAGHLTCTLTPADNQIIDQNLSEERHRLLFEVSFGPGGSKGVNHAVDFYVQNLSRIT